MPQVNKQALSQYIRSKCQRQLALNLFPDTKAYAAERAQHGMPYPQSPRPGLQHIRAAGEDWQAEKLHDLSQTFGNAAVAGTARVTASGKTEYDTTDLLSVIKQLAPGTFLVESQFDIRDGGAFQKAMGVTGHRAQFNLGYGDVRPDIIEVASPQLFTEVVDPAGKVTPLPSGDKRIQLRVIDIKLTARPSQGYFAEVAYYSMALAGWLIDEGLDSNFVVVADAAVWPGSHDASNLMRVKRDIEKEQQTPTFDQLRDAMQVDLEVVPFDVFSLYIRRFLYNDVPGVLTVVQGGSWKDLDWHVDNRCSYCDYLGEHRPPSSKDPKVAAHADHCLPQAQVDDHLSRVSFVSRGARQMLTTAGVNQVSALATKQPSDAIFETHQSLRASRTVVASRAASLQSNQSSIVGQSGTSAIMPQWADLRIFLSVDFDVGSAISVAFGLKAFWLEPRGFNSPLTAQRVNRQWAANARVVADRDLRAEQHELLAFLRDIHNIIDAVQQSDAQTQALPQIRALGRSQRAQHRSSMQVYLWDDLQFQHLARIVGRHLDAIMNQADIRHLTWLFPPEGVLENPDMATRRSPITTVRDAVKSHLAAPIPHYYSLLEIARQYHNPNLPPSIAAFNVHPLFSVPLSDQIPSERAHEIWSRVTSPPWQTQMTTYIETVKKRLSALETVAQRLEIDLRQQLSQCAPPAEVGPPSRIASASFDGQLWHMYSRLNAALDELDVQIIRAMPAHERAARFRSARLVRRLTGTEEQQCLASLGLTAAPHRYVYEMSADSRDVKFKIGEFQCALAPENNAGFLDETLGRLVRNTPLEATYQAQFDYRLWQILLEEVTGVSVVDIDRAGLRIVVDLNPQYRGVINDLINNNLLNLTQNVVLDPKQRDFFSRKLEASLRAIGNPPLAANSPHVAAVRTAIGQVGRARGSRGTPHVPVADFLWNCQAMSTTPVARNLPPIRALLEKHPTRPLTLNATQWQAWEDALSFRTRLVWGPPGTGKSRTVRAIVDGAILEAQQAGRPLRVLVTSSTYTAIDNVLLDIAKDLDAMTGGNCVTYRVRSGLRQPPAAIAPAIDVELDRHAPSSDVINLRNSLTSNDALTVVGAPPEQVHNLLTSNDDDAMQEWFDLIIIDEASQIDVAHAILPLCAIAEDGSVVLAGDPNQLPPIHQAEPPLGLENLVGSAYRFYEAIHSVPQSALDVNYRSNEEIVEFARQSGYRRSLQSHSPSLRVDLTQPLPTTVPANWPNSLPWTQEWAALLDPNNPTVTFVYEDGGSSQRNVFEADAVAAILKLIHGRVSDQLAGENDPVTGSPKTSSTTPYTDQEFWEKAVGVVTPHRAQQGLIVSRLIDVFQATGATADSIRDAVDTVERFQGQQRDIMIVSFALGDPDQIADEEEFLMSLNRFNVMASRARAKLIVLVSRQVVDHLANEVSVMRQSRLLKAFVEMFCDQGRLMTLGYHDENAAIVQVPGTFRWHA